MEQAITTALSHMQARGADRIHRLVLHVGVLSGVVPEALTFAFDVVSTGTAAQGAELTLETIPVLCYCSHCHSEFSPKEASQWVYECPQCHSISSDIRQGKELELASLEIS